LNNRMVEMAFLKEVSGSLFLWAFL
jgi:hypothetical protein